MDIFDVDGSLIRSKDLEWTEGAINFLIRLFQRVGLMANAKNPRPRTSKCRRFAQGYLGIPSAGGAQGRGELNRSASDGDSQVQTVGWS